MAKIRWAVMGAGGIARRRTIPEGILQANNAELVAVYSPQSGSDVAKQFGAVAARTEDELFEAKWDALYVASPVDCHARQVVRAAQVGRHVLCEKPLALNVEEAKRMVDACSKARVKLGVALMMRMHPHHRRAAELVRHGVLGKVTYARAQLSCWYPAMAGAWRQDPVRGGGGTLPDLASHCIDLLEMILGQTVVSVVCMKGNLVHQYPVEATAVVMLRLSEGTIATVDCLFNVPDIASPNRLEVYGSSGSLLAQGTIGQGCSGSMSYSGETTAQSYDLRQIRERADRHGGLPLEPVNLYRAEIEEFGMAIESNQEPFASGQQGLRIQRILAACQLSAETKTMVVVDCAR